jgi:hypothetical protein
MLRQSALPCSPLKEFKMAAKQKDSLWWVNPAYRGQEAIAFDALSEFPAGSIELVDPKAPPSDKTALPVRVDTGEYSSLAMILFMLNGHRPGPISGFYVVVEAVKGSGWCVGQMHADAATPVRVFREPVYDSEAAARAAAERMRIADVGNAPPRA